ncbi:type II toxin-antitoxin system HicB family antitoxin [Planococcus maritimus]|uniref:type II toxin-antitoxin system HicB family antitoxin n=1 Tax=Planococcus maritimus TaxID=192421 RepID=UPI0023303AA1|nr:type II toxin-antitoxin system HicB family antitoxin [Planococcus maritimus]
MTILTYKGYTGKVQVDLEADILHGEVIDLKDVITFQGESVSEVTTAFKDSIDDYIEFCELEGVEPEKPFSGKFIVRLTPEQHRLITVAAASSGSSLNSWVSKNLMRDAIHDLDETGISKEQVLEKV